MKPDLRLKQLTIQLIIKILCNSNSVIKDSLKQKVRVNFMVL